MTRPLNIVWFKRDLRIVDHRPLTMAARAGAVLPLYIAEPDLWSQPDASARQWAFAAEGLKELQGALAALGQPLCVMVGDAVQIFQRLYETHRVEALWSHEETGNGWTYARDLAVAAWAKGAGVPWHEARQFGVIRRLKSRDGWAKAWDRDMAEPTTPAPGTLPPIAGVWPTHIPTSAELGLEPDPCPRRQLGGRALGLATLQSFLVERCMRALNQHGWIIFRMRAMLMSFASYHFWLPWRQSGLRLARKFVDYEPGIHWPQVQMQSGTTGINTLRIYNPVKQGLDQDPTGSFVRAFVHELDAVPDAFIHQPWLWPGARDLPYPPPIVEHVAAAKAARDLLYAVRKRAEHGKAAHDIATKHGSRKAGIPMTGRKRKPAPRPPDADPQLTLDFS